MKKNLLYLFALVCSMSLFTACNDDDQDETVSPLVGTYVMQGYTTATITDADGKDKLDCPVSGPLYAEWVCEPKDEFTEAITATFKLMGGAMLPQVLNTISLDKEGNILAAYIPNPSLVFEQNWAMGAFGLPYPETSIIKNLAAKGGWVNSPVGLAKWSEKGGKFYVTLDVAAILAASLDDNSGDMAELINQILSGTPAEIKELLAVVLGADVKNVSDKTINMLLDWVKNGIPMNVKMEDGHTILYLDKNSFNPLLTAHGEENDLQIIWKAMVAKNLIPEEAQIAGVLIELISSYWAATTTFNIGLDLIKQ